MQIQEIVDYLKTQGDAEEIRVDDNLISFTSSNGSALTLLLDGNELVETLDGDYLETYYSLDEFKSSW